MPLREEDVLRAIERVDAQQLGRELFYGEVAAEIGCASDDETFQAFLARLDTTGLIESTASVDQLQGPTAFRLRKTW
jgi:hypothetical protein